MRLTINGEARELGGQRMAVAELLALLGMGDKPVAVEVNKQLVFKRNHATTPLHEGDAVEVVTMVGGG